MASSSWASTAVFLTWDDFGGFYDHVPPLFIDQEGYGFRTPLLILSPYAQATSDPSHPHVSHTLYEFSSVVRFIEKIFTLPLLDNGQDRDATANDLLDAFSLTANDPTSNLPQRCNYVPYVPNSGDAPPGHDPGYFDGNPD